MLTWHDTLRRSARCARSTEDTRGRYTRAHSSRSSPQSAADSTPRPIGHQVASVSWLLLSVKTAAVTALVKSLVQPDMIRNVIDSRRCITAESYRFVRQRIVLQSQSGRFHHVAA